VTDRSIKPLAGRLLSAFAILAALVLGFVVWRTYYAYPRTDDAYVRAASVGIAPQVSGTLVELPIVDNQRVHRGELLFVVDPRPYESALHQAKAKLSLTRVEIRSLEEAVRTAEAALRGREADAANARQYLHRIEPLLAKQFVTENEIFKARSQLAAADAAVESARADLAKTRSSLGEIGGTNARIDSAEAAVEHAQLNLDYCRVVAPFDGYVTNLNTTVGQIAGPGHPVVTLIDDRNWYVMANFREEFVGHIESGMEAEVFLPSHPSQRFKGRVQGIGWAVFDQSGAALEGVPKVEATLNWVRLAQRFPVRIVLDDPDGAFPFRMGATAVVTIKGRP
jgi:membrane fusion protein, multidrug efflux system